METPEKSPQAKTGVVGWITTHPRTVIALGVILILAVTIYLIDRGVGNRVQIRLDAIRQRGEPLSVEDLNALVEISGVEDQLDAMTGVLEQTRSLDAIRIPDEILDNLPLIGTAVGTPTGCSWPAELRNAAKWYVGQAEGQFREIHRLLSGARPRLRILFASPLIQIQLPQYSEIRTCAKALALRAMWAAEQNDRAAALQAIDDLYSLLHWNQSDVLMLGSLVEIACDALWQSCIEETVNRCGFEDQTLAVLLEKLRSRERGPDLRRAIMGERVFMLDTMQALRAGTLQPGTGLPGSAGSVMRIPILPSLNIDQSLDVYAGMIAAMETRDIDALQKIRTIGERVEALPQYYVLARLLTPSFERAVALWIRGLAMNRALQVALAAERHRLARGRWPAGVDELVPSYLPQMPLDPFDKKPIRFMVIPEGVKAWSIGEDLTDEGGDVRRLEPPQKLKPDAATDWGWVILNPELRGRPAPNAATQPAKP